MAENQQALGAEIMKEVKRYNDGMGCTRRQLVDNILILISQSRLSPASAAPVVDIERAQSVKEIAEAALESLERLDTAKLAALGRDKDADSVSNARRLLDRLLYEIAPLCRKVDSSRIRSAASLQTALEDIGLQRLHNEISSDFDVVTEGELPSPREQADRIVRVWRMTDQRDELLRWYIQQAITDNIPAAATAAPVQQSEILTQAINFCNHLAEHVAQELTEQSDNPQRDILNYEDYRKGQIQAAIEIRDRLQQLISNTTRGAR